MLTGGLKMNMFLRNSIRKLYDAASAMVASTRDALPERLQSVRDAAYLLYQKTKNKLGYGQTLKDATENKAEKEEAKKQQQDDDEQHDTVLKYNWCTKEYP